MASRFCQASAALASVTSYFEAVPHAVTHLLLKLLALLHLTGVAINKEALGHVSLGDHGVLNHV